MQKWYYNSEIGAVEQHDETLWYPNLKAGIGWHGPFNSKQETLDYYGANRANNPGWKTPTGLANVLKNGWDSLPDKANQIATDTKKAVTDPLGRFNIGGWFLRIGEILLGLILVGVGVAKLTGTANIITKAAKVAI